MHPFTDQPRDAVAALGELGLIREIRRWLGKVSPPPPYGIGDDCAVLPALRRTPLVTVDPVIYGEHFNDAVAPAAAGAKLFKRNLSDIAAMGGRPRAAVVSLALDERVKVAWLQQFYRGLAAVGRRYHVPVVGGDIARHRGGLVASLTLVGEAAGRRVLTRAGARVGDRLFVTGRLGGSLRGHHLSFTPRLDEGAWLAARPDVRSLMDLSDGLAKDVHALTPPDGQPVLRSAALPVSAAARAFARTSGRTALDHALDDGEDYELLFAVSRRTPVDAFVRAWRRRFRLPVSCIGEFRPAGETLPDGTVDLSRHHGFEHLRS
jgi:thiamine-monophosphate kinase